MFVYCIFVNSLFYYNQNHLVTRTCLNVHEVATLHRCHDLAADALSLASSQCSEVLLQPSFLTLQPDTILTLLKQPYLSVESEEELLKVGWCVNVLEYSV